MASTSPIEQLLAAIDEDDADAAMELLAPDARVLTVDGRRAEGTDAVREVLASFLASLRSTTHRITAQWHVDDVWIAELEASYELQDFLEINDLPRAVVVREGPGGVDDVRFYGAHEETLTDHATGDEGFWVGGRWIPPL